MDEKQAMARLRVLFFCAKRHSTFDPEPRLQKMTPNILVGFIHLLISLNENSRPRALRLFARIQKGFLTVEGINDT